MNNPKASRLEIIIGILILVGVIGVAGYLVLRGSSNTPNSSNNNTQNTSTVTQKGIAQQVIPIDDPTHIKINGKTVTFQEGFSIDNIVKIDTISNLSCNKGGNGCTIYFLTDGTNNYYISAPSETIAQDGLDRTKDYAKQISTQNGDVFFTYAKLPTFTNQTDSSGAPVPSDEILYSQIFGCFDNNICVSSGLFNTSDQSTNALQVQNFETFIKSVMIQ